jgi:phytoene synthase
MVSITLDGGRAMTIQMRSWEHRLLSLAYEAHQAVPFSAGQTQVDGQWLDRAYDFCTELTAKHSRSFYLASSLLPSEKQRAIRALYAFCRISDDIVDDSVNPSEATLAAWREHILSTHSSQDNLVALAWADTRLKYNIPTRYAEQLIDGVARDFDQSRYNTFEELTTYAYGVASTVGLMSMHIIGFTGPEAIPYAVKLGVALQLTNILRDVGEDFRAGRVYLPQEELDLFGITEDDLAAKRVDDRWRAFMRYQIRRNRQLYAEAWPGIAMLDSGGRLAIAAAAQFYQGILIDIEKHDYDVFNRRAFVSAWGKLRKLPGIWWRTRKGAQNYTVKNYETRIERIRRIKN